MGVLILPSRSLWKPPLGVQVNWGHPLADNLRSVWLCNEGAGKNLIDLVDPVSLGTLQGDTVFAPSSVQGMALKLDGTDDYVSIANQPRFNFERTDSLSILAGFSVSAFVAFGRILSTVEGAGAHIPGWSLFTYFSSINCLSFQEVSENDVGYYLAKMGTVALVTNKYYFGGATYNGNSGPSGISLYLNGVYDAGTESGSPISTSILSTQALEIGRYAGAAQYFNGYISPIYIWYQRVLTQNEIAWLYAEPYCFLQPVVRRFYSIPEEVVPFRSYYPSILAH